MKILIVMTIAIVSFNTFADEVIFSGKRNRTNLDCTINKALDFGGEYIEVTVKTTDKEMEKSKFLNIGMTRIGPFKEGTVDRMLSGEKFEIQQTEDADTYGAKSYNGAPFSKSTSGLFWVNFNDDEVNENFAKYNEVSFEVKEGKLRRMGFRQINHGTGILGLTEKLQFYCTSN